MPKVSIILVHFGPKKILNDCIKSIRASKPKVPYEIIVVDNNIENRGYSRGNNFGVKKAKGEYVFILNPDTLITPGVIENLLGFFKSNRKIGAVAPLLTDRKGIAYPFQGTGELTPIRGIFGLSFINKIFSNNPISKKYWLKDVKKDKPFEVDVIPGAAFLIKKKIFEKMGGFDENFFLYFEESDFCRRIKKAGYRLFIIPNAKVTHFWSQSAKKEHKKEFEKSRFYYFKKNFGIPSALIVEVFARISRTSFLFTLVLLLGIFLRFYLLKRNLIFGSELGNDYLVLKNYIDAGQLPLVGPRTSHEWLFIGPIYFWLIGAVLPQFNWSVVSGAIAMAILGTLSIPACYWVIGSFFGKRAALIASFLVSVSPLWVALPRDARFNSLAAPFFFLFYYLLVKSLKDKGRSLFLLGLTIGVMFSFFPSPILLLPSVVLLLFIFRQNINSRYILPGLIGTLIPNITFLFYNATHNFDIIRNLIIWIPYRILGFFGFYPKNTADTSVIKQNFTSLYTFFKQSWAPSGGDILAIVLTIAIAVFIVRMKKNLALTVLLMIFIVSYLGLFLHGNPPQHYYLVVFPVPIILLSLLLDSLWKKYKLAVLLLLTLIFVINMRFFFSDKWFYINPDRVSDDHYFVPLTIQEKAVNMILNDSKGKPFSLARVGPYDYFSEDFANNYRFLINVKGGKIDDNSPLRYTIYEDTSALPSTKNIYWIENLAIAKNE